MLQVNFRLTGRAAKLTASSFILILALGRITVVADEKNGMTTWCIGRYLLEMPSSWSLASSTSVIQGMQYEPLGKGNGADLRRIADARVSALRSGIAEADDVSRKFRAVEHVSDDLIVVSHQLDMSAMGLTEEDWTEEAYILSRGSLFLMVAAIPANDAGRFHTDLIRAANALVPNSNGDDIGGSGACLPGGRLTLDQVSETHSASFVAPADVPVGVELSFTLRAPEDLALDVETRFSSRAATKVEIAGLSGRQLMLETDQLSYTAIAGQSGGAGRWGQVIRAEYFDNRDDFGKPPVTIESARRIWQALLRSIRPRG